MNPDSSRVEGIAPAQILRKPAFYQDDSRDPLGFDEALGILGAQGLQGFGIR